MDACPTCPNRHHADAADAAADNLASQAQGWETLSDALCKIMLLRTVAPALRAHGEVLRARAEAERSRARSIREAGCNNWKTLNEIVRDRDTKQPIGQRTVTSCMRDKMVGYLNDIHMHAHLTGKAAESHRNVVAEGFSYIAGRPISGDGKALPDDWRKVVGISDGQKETPAALGDGGSEGTADE